MRVDEFVGFLYYHVSRKSTIEGRCPLTVDLETIIKMVDEIDTLTSQNIKKWLDDNL